MHFIGVKFKRQLVVQNLKIPSTTEVIAKAFCLTLFRSHQNEEAS